MEFSSREEGRLARERNAKRRRETNDMQQFGSLEEHEAAQRVGRAFERIHGLCVIQQEIVDRLQPLFSQNSVSDISRLYVDIFTIARNVLNGIFQISGSVLTSTDPLFHRPLRKQMALILLAMGGSLHAVAIEYDQKVWPLLSAVVKHREPRIALGPARTLLLRRETSGMQEDVREYVEALDQYVRSMES